MSGCCGRARLRPASATTYLVAGSSYDATNTRVPSCRGRINFSRSLTSGVAGHVKHGDSGPTQDLSPPTLFSKQGN